MLNIAFCKLFNTYFYCLYLCGTKSLVLKTKLHFIFFFFFIWFESTSSVTVLKVLSFWCSFYKLIGNQGFICYSSYIFLGIVIKTVLWKMLTNTYFRQYVIHYTAKTQSIRYRLQTWCFFVHKSNKKENVEIKKNVK